MIKKLFFLATIALALLTAPCAAPAQSASEDVKARPTKQDVTEQMIAAGRISPAQRDSRLDRILAAQGSSKTPRSDFMFCLGAAYLGSYRAQRCLGKAYENALGIVEDLSEAYTWYSVAIESAAKDAEEEIGPDRDRVQQKLVSSYPAPTEDELADMVKAQKSRIAQYQAEVKKPKTD